MPKSGSRVTSILKRILTGYLAFELTGVLLILPWFTGVLTGGIVIVVLDRTLTGFSPA